MSEHNLKTGQGENTPDMIQSLLSKIEKLEAKIAELNGEIAALKAEQSNEIIEKKVAERVALVTVAKSIVGDTDLSAKSDTDIRKSVIIHKYGADILTGADSAALKGMFKIAIQDAAKNSQRDPINPAQFVTHTQTQDAAYQARVERLRTHYKGA